MNAASEQPKVVLLGASGRMGVAVSAKFLTDGKVKLVGACDLVDVGKTVGSLSGLDIDSPLIVRSVNDLPDSLEVDVVLDFSKPDGIRENLNLIMERGWDLLIGATGHTEEDIEIFTKSADKYSRRIVLVPNFTLGVNLMLKFSSIAAKVFNDVEIIEMHHDKKVDAPSGTALHTARLIADASGKSEPPGLGDDSRGRIEENIPIHAIRLPGLLAHQEIIFGSDGEVLRIRHDTTDRAAFLSGIYLALSKIKTLPPGFTHGLNWVFE